ncbi:lytic transglycosylase domain-containing protein [Salibacterium qingdaonense]|uniref:Soluble lytic murein transglycosylase n=1 Tax=Salibacterium qingdaonense TaxID=266892 RepID=A0A1I4IJ65_9BACI|nr:lytic transglycosylase domain-containing protein [Salibacterium qingdaonense]SFL54358.1 Soluble lytic murein transglycosylase [Salibacterium qingdaonense]
MRIDILLQALGQRNSLSGGYKNQSPSAASSIFSSFQSYLEQEMNGYSPASASVDASTSKSSGLFLNPEAQSRYNAAAPVHHTASSTASPSFSGDYDSMIQNSAERHNVDPDLVRAVIQQESSFDSNARSHAGAMGLMQLMPGTANYLNVSDPYNPAQNIEGGTKYLKQMLDKYDGDKSLALAAYNAGPGNVDQHNGIPPFSETQSYVPSVLSKYNNMA